jgi:PAS domain S-box-containing protein
MNMSPVSSLQLQIKRWFRSLELRSKLTFVLVVTTTTLGAVVAMLIALLQYQHLASTTDALLTARATLERREAELKLTSMLDQALSLTRDPLIVVALASSQGREHYLTHLLRNQALAVPGALITIVDYRGRGIASMADHPPDFSASTTFLAMMQADTSHAAIAGEYLHIGLPIRAGLADITEGAAMLTIPLGGLLGHPDSSGQQHLVDAQGRSLVGSAPRTAVFEHRTRLELPVPMDALGLTLILTQTRTASLQGLYQLLALILGAGLLVTISMYYLARAGTRIITAPLANIAIAAESIAASGLPVTRLPAGDNDEFGRLANAFNTMVDRLSESYVDLEQRVAERTREYEESRHDAERASNLLREAVSSIAQGFTIYDENDRLVMCNEAYRHFYESSRDLIVPGNTFEEIVRRGAERGQYQAAKGNIDAWVSERVRQHQNANGEVIEQKLDDGRWLLIVEYRTPSGFIVGNRIDISDLKRATEELRQRELYQRATLDNLPFFFWLKDEQSRFLAVNKLFANACGHATPEEVVGLTDLDIWPRELAEAYRADDAEVIASRHEKTVEEPVAGGTEGGWIETYKRPVIDASNRVLGTVGFARDVSERKRMEQALSESEERWALAVKGTNDGIWDWNIRDDSVYFSDRWQTMLGYEAGEFSGHLAEWKNLLHPDDVARVTHTIEQHFAGLTEFYEVEFRLRCKDGTYKWILGRGKALFDAVGKPLRMTGSHTDVSERRVAEARIRDRTEQLNAIFALSPDGFVAFDPEHCVKYASPAFLRMSGMSEAEIVGLAETTFGLRLTSLCRPDAGFPGIQALRSAAQKVGAGGTAEKSTGHVRHLLEMAGAGKRILEVGLREADAETISQLLYFRDVTHEVEVESMKSEFLSTAAHELRTPMASIYGFTELLLNQDFTPTEQRDLLTTIFRQSELIVSIINELLDLSRIEDRRGKDFRLEAIDLNDLLTEIVNGFNPPEHRPPPQFAPSANLPTVRGDRNKLTQAVSNVLSNAYKYSPAGGAVTISLITDSSTTPGVACTPRCGIHIVDQGIGMTSTQTEHICERFYRADNSGKIPGTGLGMSIVKEIIELHGGQIDVRSEVAHGTAVSLWLPAVFATDHDANHILQPIQLS